MTLTFDPATHTYELDGRKLPSVSEILQSAGLGFQSFGNDAEEAKRRGTYVHAAAAMLNRGEALDADGIPEEYLGYVEAFISFRREFPLTVEAVEIPVVHEEYGYAGTPDLRGWVPKRGRWIFDYKTGESLPRDVPVQLSAYAACNVPHISGLAAVLLRSNGRYLLQEYNDAQRRVAFNTWLCALNIYRWKKGI